HRRGICSGASLMANQPWAAEAVAMWRANPDLGLGLHLTLTAGRPVAPPERVSSLLAADGRFHALPAFVLRAQAGALRPDELRRELGAQVERALALGARLDHLDAHHHVHAFPAVGHVALRLAGDYRIPALRVPCDLARPAGP